VVQNVLDLARPERIIDEDSNCPRSQNSEECRRRIRSVRKIDSSAVTGFDP
jgi:hypothetical protein